MRARLSSQPSTHLDEDDAPTRSARESAADLEQLELRTELEVTRAAFLSSSPDVVSSLRPLDHDSVTCLVVAPVSGGRARRRPPVAAKSARRPKQTAKPDSVTMHVVRPTGPASAAISLDNACLEDDAPTSSPNLDFVTQFSTPAPNRTLESHAVLGPRGAVYKTGARAAVRIVDAPSADPFGRTAHMPAARPPAPSDFHESTPVRPVALGTARSASSVSRPRLEAPAPGPRSSFPPPATASDRAPQPSWVETPWMLPSGPVTVRPAHEATSFPVLPIAAAATAALAVFLVGVILFVMRSSDASHDGVAHQTTALQADGPPAALFPPPPVLPTAAPPAAAPPVAAAEPAPAAAEAVPTASRASTKITKVDPKPAPVPRVVRAEPPRASAAPPPPKPAAAKPTKSGGKSVEDILNELGEEQLKR